MYAENYIYNKQDGSLNDGIEIVTQPMDREFMDKFLDMLGDKIDKIKEFSSGDTSRNAGIHIHTTRDKIPKDIQRKIHLLFNYCFDMENVKYLSFLVGRRKTIKAEHDNMGYCACGCGNMTRQAGRHEAVNFNNEDTIEFRMFKSTLNIEQIKSYFDIVDLSIEFCDKTPISYININNFLYYIKKNSNNKLLLKKIKSIEKDKAVELSIEKNEITTVNPFKDMDTDKLYRMYNACDFRNRRKVELVLKQKLIDDILKQQSEVVECA